MNSKKRNLSRATKVRSIASDCRTLWAAASRKNISSECHSFLSLFSEIALLPAPKINPVTVEFVPIQFDSPCVQIIAGTRINFFVGHKFCLAQ